MPCVQSFGHQDQRCCSLSAASRRPALSLRAVDTRSDVSRNTDLTRLAMIAEKPVNPVTEFSSAQDRIRWLLPRHFRRQKARRCTRRSAPALPKAGRRNIAQERSIGLHGIRERRPSSARADAVRGRKARRLRADSLHCCAARWANLHIIFDAPVARPDVGQKPSLTARAKRRTTPTSKRRRRPNR